MFEEQLKEIAWTKDEVEVLKTASAEKILNLNDQVLEKFDPETRILLKKIQLKLLGAVNNKKLYWGPSVFWAQKLNRGGEKLVHLSSVFIATMQ